MRINPKDTQQKSKSVSILLAVFLSYWTWLYTFKNDYKKFWFSLGLSFLFTVSTGLIYFGSFPDIMRVPGLIVFLPGFPVYTGLWTWAIIGTSVRPTGWYSSYPPDNLNTTQTGKDIGRLWRVSAILVLCGGAIFILRAPLDNAIHLAGLGLPLLMALNPLYWLVDFSIFNFLVINWVCDYLCVISIISSYYAHVEYIHPEKRLGWALLSSILLIVVGAIGFSFNYVPLIAGLLSLITVLISKKSVKTLTGAPGLT